MGRWCEVSPPAVLVRRQPFIGPVGQGCRMGCQLHADVFVHAIYGTATRDRSSQRKVRRSGVCVGRVVRDDGEMRCRSTIYYVLHSIIASVAAGLCSRGKVGRLNELSVCCDGRCSACTPQPSDGPRAARLACVASNEKAFKNGVHGAWRSCCLTNHSLHMRRSAHGLPSTCQNDHDTLCLLPPSGR